MTNFCIALWFISVLFVVFAHYMGWWKFCHNTKVGTPSASHNSHYVPCFECNQLMCKAKTYFGSPECTVARGKHST
jgi:hypothetical protein